MTAESPPPTLTRTQRAVEQLCREVAELRQLVAALTLVVSDGADTEFVEAYEQVVGWALEEFDPEILQECLAQYDLPPVTAPVVLETPVVAWQPAESQKQLFSDEEPHDEGAHR